MLMQRQTWRQSNTFENFFSEQIKNAENKLSITTQESVVNLFFLISCLAEHLPVDVQLLFSYGSLILIL